MTPDERVAAHVLEQFRATRYSHPVGSLDVYQHVRDCPSTQAHVEEQGDGRCGEGTCEVLYVEAEMRCEHGTTYDYAYRESGEIAELLARLAKMGQAA